MKMVIMKDGQRLPQNKKSHKMMTKNDISN